jgi:hypothetical protein
LPVSILLAPDSSGVSSLLAQNLGVCNALTAWANALLNTALYPLDPKPSWYDSLDTTLSTARTAAQQWVETNGPDLQSQVAQSLIDFGSLFAATSTDLQQTMTAIAASANKKATAQQIADLAGDIAVLITNAQLQGTTAATLQTSVETFATTIATQRTAIESDITSANATLQADEKIVTDYQARIASLQGKLGIDALTASNDTKSAATSSLSLFGSLFMFSMLTIATDGAAAPFMAIAVGTVGTSVNGAEGSAADKSVQADLAALGELQTQLTAEDQQVAGLDAIVTTLRKLEQCNFATSNAMDDLAPLWDDVTVRLQAVAEVLTQPSVDVSLISGLTTLDQSATAWQTIVTAATNVQSSSVTMTAPVTLTANS